MSVKATDMQADRDRSPRLRNPVLLRARPARDPLAGFEARRAATDLAILPDQEDLHRNRAVRAKLQALLDVG